MTILPYHLSSGLQKTLYLIEKNRVKLLAIPLPLKMETRYKWEATLEKIYLTAGKENKFQYSSLAKLIYNNSKKQLSPNEVEVIAYKKGLDYISENWYANPKRLTPKNIKTLYQIAIGPVQDTKLPTSFFKKDLKLLLDYIQSGKDNPINLAGSAYFHLLLKPELKETAVKLATLTSYLVMYKYGLSFRGMIVFEEFINRDTETFKRAMKYSLKVNDLTYWLEYFSYCILSAISKTLKEVNSGRYAVELSSNYFKINSRQKEILTRLEVPDENISNKGVQEMFGISQITASRDLAHLAKLGLIAPLGKGRSIHYIKV
jgi:hypothetical protein